MQESNRLPNFFVVGAAKSGTSSLYHYLDQHPQVYMSPIKEVNYFATDIDPAHFSEGYKKREAQKKLDLPAYVAGPMDRKIFLAYVRQWDHYQKLFKHVTDEVAIGEVSNSYLYSDTAAGNIAAKFPDARIVMILRNPVTRIYSHYLNKVRDGRTTRPFRAEVEHDRSRERKGWSISHLYFELGQYAAQIQRFRDHFPDEQLRMYLYDDLKENPRVVLDDLFAFLNVDPAVAIDTDSRHNAAALPRSKNLVRTLTRMGIKKAAMRLVPEGQRQRVKNLMFTDKNMPPLSPEDRNYLIEVYRDEVLALGQLLQRDLNHWLQPG